MIWLNVCSTDKWTFFSCLMCSTLFIRKFRKIQWSTLRYLNSFWSVFLPNFLVPFFWYSACLFFFVLFLLRFFFVLFLLRFFFFDLLNLFLYVLFFSLNIKNLTWFYFLGQRTAIYSNASETRYSVGIFFLFLKFCFVPRSL